MDEGAEPASQAEKPRWRRALSFVLRANERSFRDNLSILSAGVAFYAFLSIFPAIAGGLMIWGLFAEPHDIRASLGFLAGVVPRDAFTLVVDQLIRISEAGGAEMTFGAILSFLFAMWSASRAAQAMMAVVDVAYDLERPRGFVASNLAALRFTLTGVVFAALSLAAIGAVPPLLEALRLGAVADALIRLARWVLVVGVFTVVAGNAYRNTPSHRKRRKLKGRGLPIWRGALVASAIWLVASFAFSFYLAAFDAYNETFGSLGAVAALLMWFYISAYAIGIGAEVNAELEDARATREAMGRAPAAPGGAALAEGLEQLSSAPRG